jgi:hypothetical protein
MPEVSGMQQTLEFAGAMAAFAPEVLDNFDTDAMVTRARYLLGAPPLAQRKPEHVKGLRKEKAKAQQAQQMAQQATQAVETAGKLPDAAEGVAALGNMAGLAGAMPQLAGMAQTVQ